MMRSPLLKRFAAGLLAFLISQPTGLLQAQNAPATHQGWVKKYHVPEKREPAIERDELIKLVRQKIKYVFVLYQENRSFDSYFGTFPGAEGLFSKTAEQTPGFSQALIDTDGSTTLVHPFRIGPKEFAADTDDIDHSHLGIVAKMNIQNGVPKMDQFAKTEELKYSPGGKPSLKAKQFGELTMAYEDCDTIPLLWAYADKFVLFDHIFQLMTGPSTPGNLAIIGAQTGETQWVLHPEEAYKGNGGSGKGVPVLNGADPFWGSQLDPTPQDKKMPVNPKDADKGAKSTANLNLTYATLPLTLPGGSLPGLVESDMDPKTDLRDVGEDVGYIGKLNNPSVTFGWFEEGYDKEPTDPDDGPEDANGTHASYITHHNGPQYFGYVSNNPEMRKQLHGLEDFFEAVEKRQLPKDGGVFYVKGGYKNIFGLRPANPDAKVQASFLGDDDHPGYSDAQISEAMIAEAINKIASSPYWRQCAIIITWDDCDGLYDHVPPPARTRGPDGSVISDGPRVPLILISPYARTHYVVHADGNHASVVKFIDTVFHLPPLALLPDESRARQIGAEIFGQPDLGPHDAITPGVTDLLDAFSVARLKGIASRLPAEYVRVPKSRIRNLPQATGYGCKSLGIVTTDRAKGIVNQVPRDFNPRPKTNPTPAEAEHAATH